jgi:hypothetical protein
MKTVIVEINNPKALNLLQELEDLNILRIVKESVIAKKMKLSEKYKGVFTKEDSKSFNEHTHTMRKEWDNT